MANIIDSTLDDFGLILLLTSLVCDIYLTFKILFSSQFRKNTTSLILCNVTLNRAVFITISIAGFFNFDSNYCTKLFIQFTSVCGVIFFTFLLVLAWLVKNSLGEGVHNEIKNYYRLTTFLFYLAAFLVGLKWFDLSCDYVSVVPDFLEAFIFYLQLTLVVFVISVNAFCAKKQKKRVNVDIYLANIICIYFVFYLINGFLMSVYEPVPESSLSVIFFLSGLMQTASIFIVNFFRRNVKYFLYKTDVEIT